MLDRAHFVTLPSVVCVLCVCVAGTAATVAIPYFISKACINRGTALLHGGASLLHREQLNRLAAVGSNASRADVGASAAGTSAGFAMPPPETPGAGEGGVLRARVVAVHPGGVRTKMAGFGDTHVGVHEGASAVVRAVLAAADAVQPGSFMSPEGMYYSSW